MATCLKPYAFSVWILRILANDNLRSVHANSRFFTDCSIGNRKLLRALGLKQAKCRFGVSTSRKHAPTCFSTVYLTAGSYLIIRISLSHRSLSSTTRPSTSSSQNSSLNNQILQLPYSLVEATRSYGSWLSRNSSSAILMRSRHRVTDVLF